ncbi:MAG: nucleoside hydrolase [Chloroflexi bacterium]|nr:nucleoside hydrolase [Chloroflexota bacterium]
MSEAPIPVILDVDTGIDDALAIALAVNHPRVALEAVTTVAGNVSLERTTANSLRVLDWLGARSVPVSMGAEGPLVGSRREASYWHAEDGLGGARLPESTRSADADAIGYLCERLLASPGTLTVVCTGPLTNVALALQREPRIVACVREVVLMGGAARLPGNITPVAEFNIYADPEAAARVFEQSWPITMVGLDVTERVRLERADQVALSADDSAGAVLLREVCRFLFDERGVDSIALHDPLALAVAVQPDLVVTKVRDVRVETRGEHTRGQTVVDWRRTVEPAHGHTRVCTEVDVDRARAFFFTTLLGPAHRAGRRRTG